MKYFRTTIKRDHIVQFLKAEDEASAEKKAWELADEIENEPFIETIEIDEDKYIAECGDEDEE